MAEPDTGTLTAGPPDELEEALEQEGSGPEEPSEVASESDDSGDNDNRAPGGALRWPAPDRDSPLFGELSGSYTPDEKLRIFLKMNGQRGRSELEIKQITGFDLKRPRRWHKLFERMGVLYPGEGITRVGRLGRLLSDMAEQNGVKIYVVKEVISFLKRYQFDNPIERRLPAGNSVHPYFAVWKAASLLDWRIHWDEVNRELMWIMNDDEIDEAVNRISEARKDPKYDAFIGGEDNEAGILKARARPAEGIAPKGKTAVGQLRDQKMTPFLKMSGFGELLLRSPGAKGRGYWSIPEDLRSIITEAVASPPQAKSFSSEREWIDWYYEQSFTSEPLEVNRPFPRPATPVAALTFAALRDAISKYEPDLIFSDKLLATIVAALRSGDGRSFIILRGISGTGKSRLVSAIAKAVYGTEQIDAPQLTFIEVRPDWTDGSPLLGHFDPIAAKYVPQRFLDAMLAAADQYDKAGRDAPPVFVCLDEMNLARVEYYLADCLSAMETGNSVALDTRADRSFPASVKWPPNLFLFGTVNIDETTLSISDKVLDRAQVVDTSDINLSPQLKKWLELAKELSQEEQDRVSEILGGAWQALRKVEAHFGFRSARAIVRFVNESKASSGGIMSIDDALDTQIIQKVLVKLRGEGERWNKPLSELSECFEKLSGEKKAARNVARMRADLEHLGSFQFWH